MRNRVELGTTAPFADGMQFFLPEQDAGPTAVAWAAGEASIPLGASERLLLTRRDSVVETRRVAK